MFLLCLGGCQGFLSLASISSFMFLTAQGVLGLWSRALFLRWAAPSLSPILDMREPCAVCRRRMESRQDLMLDLTVTLCTEITSWSLGTGDCPSSSQPPCSTSDCKGYTAASSPASHNVTDIEELNLILFHILTNHLSEKSNFDITLYKSIFLH